ncbi:MAG: hypothetical protein R3B40_28690 [Polyangiales bacterium]
MTRKRANTGVPRRLRLDRAGRLDAARAFVTPLAEADGLYGRRAVHRYAKWFGVDLTCAVIELQMLGLPLCATYVERLSRHLLQRKTVVRRRRQPLSEDALIESNAQFSYIAGYTAGGAPYGIPRDDA